jgi:hypothetical protein
LDGWKYFHRHVSNDETGMDAGCWPRSGRLHGSFSRVCFLFIPFDTLMTHNRYISRSVAGSYDNEAVAIFAMVCTFWLWLVAVDTGSLLWSALCALSYGYMVAAWGGYVFVWNIIAAHAFVLGSTISLSCIAY